MTHSRIRIIAGTGRYTDPWHPFAETARCMADLLGEAGHKVEIAESTPEAFTELTDTDLVVINCGGNPEVELAPEPIWQQSFQAFERWLGSGHPVLGVHAASNAFPDWPAWPELLGGRWVRGRSHHPPRTEFTFKVPPAGRDHPALGGLTHVSVLDERYSELDVSADAVPLLQHRFDDKDQVMAWALQRDGRKTVYDGLGHDAQSFASADRRRLLTAEVGWLLASD
ncbi:ThuA domain-containing protein [Microlunatus sp. Gsoil 973]|uniref:ThuA domain-containing protein n=1 Tax=Microlunatus sp. Gsoil 973 TaxID=2672569 RepID=UPI0012B47736|nr:ThuA domain-containing protein [Microlunatus sp. Gsoil 973]QGN31570.1 glycosyl hydrolase [Microlunatus sp. Gsoil 973]